MAVPSLSVTVHDRYDPELRERIREKLEASMAGSRGTDCHLQTPRNLRALALLESPNTPVLSVYLQLSPERRVGKAWETVFTSLADATQKRIDERRKRQMVQDELARIREALREKMPTLGRGVAIFACEAIGLSEWVAVQVPLPDGIHFGARPYVRPLVWTQDEHDRFVLVLLSQERGRYFTSQIGQVDEVLQIRGQTLHHLNLLTDRVPRDRRDVVMTEVVHNEVKVLAAAAELTMAQFEGRHLLLAGAPDLRSAVVRELPKDMQQRVGGTFAVEFHLGTPEVAAAAEPAQRAVEEQEELATVGRLIDAGPKASAWGVQPTLDALRDGRVLTLAVDDMFVKPGAYCGNCGALLASVPNACPICGSDMVRAVEDIVEMAIERTLEERGALELVRSAAARQRMSQCGPMAALLRW